MFTCGKALCVLSVICTPLYRFTFKAGAMLEFVERADDGYFII